MQHCLKKKPLIKVTDRMIDDFGVTFKTETTFIRVRDICQLRERSTDRFSKLSCSEGF